MRKKTVKLRRLLLGFRRLLERVLRSVSVEPQFRLESLFAFFASVVVDVVLGWG